MTTTGSAPETLRASMVDHIIASGHARTSRVERALRSVPRHRFVPDATIEDAYADIAVITKRDAEGAALSCTSVPTIVAMMLDQLDVAPVTAFWRSAREPAITPRCSPTSPAPPGKSPLSISTLK